MSTSTVPSFVAVMFTRMGLFVTPGNFGILTSVIFPGIINSILVFEVPANVRNAFLLCPLVCSAVAYMYISLFLLLYLNLKNWPQVISYDLQAANVLPEY